MSSLLVSDIIKMAEKQMADAGIQNGKNDAEIIYCFMKRIDRSRFFMQWSEPADDMVCERFFDLVARRCKREPLQLIVGETEFMGLRFKVMPGVLIPRMDSESVVEKAEEMLGKTKKKNVLDLCCGSGILGICLAKRAGAKVTAGDISEKALAAAAENAKINGVKLDVRQGDLFDAIGKKKYDLIVSNPPYIKRADMDALQPEIRNYDPPEALDGGEDGLDFYRRITADAPAHLKKGGALVLEIGDDQAEEISRMLETDPAYGAITVSRDLAGRDRVITAEYTGK